MLHKKHIIIIIALAVFACEKREENRNDQMSTSSAKLETWQDGYLDIHHINTGRGNASFFVLPDGTTVLFDAGNIEKKKWEKTRIPLKVSKPMPNDSISAAEFIAVYARQVMPKRSNASIDYAIISHFHKDHYGSFLELNKQLPFNKIIDRDYPNYNFPLNLEEHQKNNRIFQAYLNFIDSTAIPIESLKPGITSQITLLDETKKYPDFFIRNIKSNGTIWTGKNEETFEYFTAKEMTNYYKGKYNENPLSLALKISYGKFDYFAGGDNTGLQGFGLPYWFDVETPIAKAVGKVEVTTLNHHGNRDATNEFFVKTLDPKVVIQQTWCTDHPGQEVFHRLIYKDEKAESRDIFATSIHDETKVTYGPWFIKNYKSMQGHVVVRVYPGGEKYEVIILNDDTTALTIKDKFGPYYSK